MLRSVPALGLVFLLGLALASAVVLADDEHGTPGTPTGYDTNSNSILDSWDIDDEGPPVFDMRDVNEDGWNDQWNNDGTWVAFANLASAGWTPHASQICWQINDATCICKDARDLLWTCYKKDTGNACYDSHTNNQKELNQAITCKNGKAVRRFQTG